MSTGMYVSVGGSRDEHVQFYSRNFLIIECRAQIVQAGSVCLYPRFRKKSEAGSSVQPIKLTGHHSAAHRDQ